MQEFYFQVLITAFATMITGFIGWMSLNIWRSTGKIASLELEIMGNTKDLNTISEDIKALRKYDAQIAVLNVENRNMKADIGGIFQQLREIQMKI